MIVRRMRTRKGYTMASCSIIQSTSEEDVCGDERCDFWICWSDFPMRNMEDYSNSMAIC
jgi:hypothetical protein